jgi:hypothetical protein
MKVLHSIMLPSGDKLCGPDLVCVHLHNCFSEALLNF